jgi:hypothetical protein
LLPDKFVVPPKIKKRPRKRDEQPGSFDERQSRTSGDCKEGTPKEWPVSEAIQRSVRVLDLVGGRIDANPVHNRLDGLEAGFEYDA